MTVCVFFTHGIVHAMPKDKGKNTRLEQVFAQNLRSKNWRDWYNAVAARLWGSVSRRSPQIYPNNKPLLSLPLPSSASRPTQFLIRIFLLRNSTASLERRKGQEYCTRGDWKLELNWLPSRISQTQGLEQRAPTPIPDSLVIPPSLWVSPKIPKRRNGIPPISLQSNFKLQLFIFHSLLHRYSFHLYIKLMLILPFFNVCLVIYVFFIFVHVSFT